MLRIVREGTEAKMHMAVPDLMEFTVKGEKEALHSKITLGHDIGDVQRQCYGNMWKGNQLQGNVLKEQ